VPDKDYSHRLLIDKLGVKFGQSVCAIGVEDEAFWQQLRERTADVLVDQVAPESDAIVFAAPEPSYLERLPELMASIKPNGMIWVVSPKGRKDFKDTDVMNAGLAVGLVDVKVCSFNKELTATKFVFRLKDRPRR
jgi:hypothetical protein